MALETHAHPGAKGNRDEQEESSTLRDSRGETVPEEHSRIHYINNITTGKQFSELVVFQFRRRVDGKWQHRGDDCYEYRQGV